MIKVVSFKICPFVQRVTAMLEAKQLAYEVIFIQLNEKPDWFLALSPTGQVPILIPQDGPALFESEAIIEYLDDVAPPLRPGPASAETRALTRAWSLQASKLYLIQCSAMQSADEPTFRERMTKLDQGFSRIEAASSKGPYFSGPALGNVDIALLPLLHRAALVQRRATYDQVAAHPRLKRIQTTLLEGGLAERSVSGDFEQAFGDFYLSERTWLGRGARSEGEAAMPAPAPAPARGCCG